MADLAVDVDRVADAIRVAHTETVAPLFRSETLAVSENEAGELVTTADRACEEALALSLQTIADIPIIGEERAASEPSILAALDSDSPMWIVDPIDGTSNFAAGRPDYAVMVALADQGECVAGWIFQPERSRMLVAVKGAGVMDDGTELEAPRPSSDPSSWSGIVKDRFLPPEVRQQVEVAHGELGPRGSVDGCAGTEYPDLIDGRVEFLLYWRTLPWDHAAGVLLAEESGCRALRPNGRAFSLRDGGSGLVVAHESIVDDVRRRLFA